ncbi:hypothetical protein [Micromonospora sp. CNB394]|uniref:hypothetical protein n=1 Tax=Micromonospora sp. CNB394 TaxID=1169151 RepID=UPI0012DF1CB0|nr:hypothetical protein [Micromonospora sp. CNB394]
MDISHSVTFVGPNPQPLNPMPRLIPLPTPPQQQLGETLRTSGFDGRTFGIQDTPWGVQISGKPAGQCVVITPAGSDGHAHQFGAVQQPDRENLPVLRPHPDRSRCGLGTT